ncbi:hypothetical protein [Paraburkholderia phosphatilytica]|uniref:hypothetical protein n=1 Tax=Paraburkholderia phosphatilytica TaxID=2282883 RepID=UPI000E47FB92|nr:hypothetical protein [Paraburkholderia phosphatilytica]
MVQPIPTTRAHLPHEGIAAHDAHGASSAQQLPPESPQRSPRASTGGALGALTPRVAVEAESSAGPSRTGKAPLTARQASASATAPATAVSREARQREIQAVVELADEIHTLEKQLADLMAPPEPADAAPPMSKGDLQQVVRRLEASRADAAGRMDELGVQCEEARKVVEQLNASLAGKTQRLARLQEEHAAALPRAPSAAAWSTPRPAPSAASASHAPRIDALTKRIASLQESRKAAAGHAGEVAVRDKMRALTVVAAFESMDTVTLELKSEVKTWLRGLPKPSTRAVRRPGDLDRQFQKALKTAFAPAPEGDATAEHARAALGAFMQAASSTGLESIGPDVEDNLADDMGRSLRVATVGSRSGKSLDQMNRVRRWLNQAPSRVVARHITSEFRKALEDMSSVERRGLPTIGFGSQVLTRQDVAAAVPRLRAMVDHLEKHPKALESMIDALEHHFVQAHEVDDVEKMGQTFGPGLDAVYGAQIAGLNRERTALNREAERKRQPGGMQSAITETSTRGDGVSLDQLEVRIGRLAGEIERYTAQHKKEFENYAGLSARHMAASDDLDAIEVELAAHRKTLGELRDAHREGVRRRAARGDEAGRVEAELDRRWEAALRNPELHKLIAPDALVRAVDVHVGQRPEEMRARLTSVARHGVFRSRASVLRVIADIAKHELAKSGSALLAPTSDEIERIARGGRVDALCNHGREIGQGVRNSARGIETARTSTSQYAIEWRRGDGPRISHLHPWVSPY